VTWMLHGGVRTEFSKYAAAGSLGRNFWEMSDL